MPCSQGSLRGCGSWRGIQGGLQVFVDLFDADIEKVFVGAGIGVGQVKAPVSGTQTKVTGPKSPPDERGCLEALGEAAAAAPAMKGDRRTIFSPVQRGLSYRIPGSPRTKVPES